MKRLVFIVLALQIWSLSQAQVKIGGKIGLNFSDQHATVGGTVNSTNLHAELQAGLVADVHVHGNFYVQPQLLYSRKGATHKAFAGGGNTSIKMNYIEVPVNLVYKKEVAFGKVFFGGGPVAGYGFGGEIITNDQAVKLYSSGLNQFSRYDVSANVTFGVELPFGIFGSVVYQHGFKDIHKAADITVKNRTVSLSAGILF